MSFGLTNNPTAFMDLMYRVFWIILSFYIDLIDNILEYSNSKDEQMVHLRLVLEVLKECPLLAKFCKCEFLLI